MLDRYLQRSLTEDLARVTGTALPDVGFAKALIHYSGQIKRDLLLH